MHVQSKVFLAPMAGITDPAFRALCATYGAGMTTTELVSAKGLLQQNSRTQALIARANEEKNFAIQLFGTEPKIMAQAAQHIEPYCDSIDINMGCPVEKVCKLGAGSALLKNPKRAGEIVRAMTRAVAVPVTAKMRIGLSSVQEKTAQALARACEENGASMITVHGRTQAQKYSGTANWHAIQAIKNAVGIPVVGNGDITTPELAKLRLTMTDYIAVGRACSGNPLLFSQINTYLKTGAYEECTPDMRLASFEKYLLLAKEFNTPLTVQRLQAQHFTKGIEKASQARLALNSATTPQELLRIVSSLLKPQD